MVGSIDTTGAMPGTERMMDSDRDVESEYPRNMFEQAEAWARKQGKRAQAREWRAKREAKELAQAIANGTANTCVTCGKMMVNGHDQYRRVPWHGMQPTGDMLCDACWEAENAQSPLLTLQAMQKAVVNRERAAAEREEARRQANRERYVARRAHWATLRANANGPTE
jgi:hypothetical protein